MREREVLDVGDLPLHGFGSASPTWWGTLVFMLLEGSGFGLMIAVYLYLMSLAPQWPINAPPPDLWAGTLVTVLLVASLVPNYLIARWAEKRDLRKVRIGVIVMTAFGIAPLVVRAFEFTTLNVSWDTNAYGSTLWTMLGLHTTHVITDLADTVVLLAIMFSRHADNPRRYGDIADNALYWNFVVATWLPIYLCVYWIPRL
jgi:heme/copper-type cytochrome/quinol oxidase subunit 3